MTDTGFVERLERLERDNRRLKRIALVALVLLGVAAGLGATYATPVVPREVVAQRFVLEDAHGRVRATLGVKRDLTGLTIYDTLGRTRVMLLVGPHGSPSLDLLHAKGEPGVFLEAYPDGSEGVYLPGTKAAVGLSIDADGSPAMSLTDAAGYSSVLGVTDLVTPATGQTRETSAASLVMFDSAKHVIWQAPR